ncbi:4966_t:CDS:2, partial [Acaulospora colombiana]
RLKRCGAATLLDIDIQYVQFAPKGMYADLVLHVTTLLTAENVCLVGQWKRLSIGGPPPPPARHLWNQALSRPTPNLLDFQASNLVFEMPILPFAPLLEHLTVVDCSFEMGSTLKQLKTLAGDVTRIRNLEASLHSNRLMSLQLIDYRPSSHLTAYFPLLVDLSVEGRWTNTMALCKGIAFHQLVTLHLDCLIADIGDYTKAAMGMREIIKASTNVDQFETAGPLSLRILLLSLQE